ncbi:hypothetical protein H257_17514 [Aphanomyces astaci]|uniref:Uncharacterized protein n=1 Tax=Aphanomyces astaci TaxID=112090 RepID=W4FG80_APHAT|nr:hypothetical protein H257_17514 [Aphanomyces astaci]ETV65874.1 hypothetical protein H257_17514 [Aphanomyces astaci]|eukprot:XP_009844627.1 hypothetical protein H257_17514 [Aphanomyces astaci]
MHVKNVVHSNKGWLLNVDVYVLQHDTVHCTPVAKISTPLRKTLLITRSHLLRNAEDPDMSFKQPYKPVLPSQMEW